MGLEKTPCCSATFYYVPFPRAIVAGILQKVQIGFSYSTLMST